MTRTAKLLHLVALTAAAALFLATTTSAKAQSQQNSGQRAAVVKKLAEKYGETRQSVGIGSNNAMVEVFASNDTGS
jgi:orotate phosphoribosyltransferase